jgi:HlyD family secretion protein
MTRKKWLIGGVIVVVLGAITWANVAFKRAPGTEVTTEKIQRRDLEAIVTASGTIQPKRLVQISAETMGKVTNLAVNEGDAVKAGQFLLQIDPRNLQTNVQNRESSLAAARSVLEETRKSVENTKLALKTAKDNLARQEKLYKDGLATREVYERAQDEVTGRQTDLQQREQSLKTQETRIKQEEAMLDSANYDLTKVRITSPIDGLVTRRNIEAGETAMMGTMNNAGTVLLTIADLSIIQAEIQVDETDIPFVSIGQVSKVKIDAFPDKEFPGHVTEVGNSPIQTAASSATRATNFKVVVTLNSAIPDVRPGFTCSAVITTATRQQAVSVPIQATTVREMIIDAKGILVRDPPPAPGQKRPAVAPAPAELKPDQKRKEIEGVFVVRDGRALFVPIKAGIAGEKFFEVLDGLKDGDEVVTGPFASVRNLKDYDPVKITGATAAPAVK